MGQDAVNIKLTENIWGAGGAISPGHQFNYSDHITILLLNLFGFKHAFCLGGSKRIFFFKEKKMREIVCTLHVQQLVAKLRDILIIPANFAHLFFICDLAVT